MSDSPVIEIHGTNTQNRGAELMAIAIAEQLRQRYDKVKIVVPAGFGDLNSLVKHDFYTTSEQAPSRYLRLRNLMRRSFGLPPTMNTTALEQWFLRQVSLFSPKRHRTIHPRDIDFVLDASGFAFGDQWGAKFSQRLYEKMERPARKGKPLVLLPQALGTFEQPATATATQKLIHRASRCFARDIISKQQAEAIALETDRIALCPDFTPLVAPFASGTSSTKSPYCSIVPNYRMLDKGDDATAYLDFLSQAAGHSLQGNQQIVFVLHDSDEDKKVMSLLADRGIEMNIYTSADPRELKGFLGGSQFVIGSRFHALVSSLSQGVPCIGAGWSHKYPELFADYDCGEFHLADLKDSTSLKQRIDRLSDEEENREIRKRIHAAGQNIKDKIHSMWNEVFDLIDQAIH